MKNISIQQLPSVYLPGHSYGTFDKGNFFMVDKNDSEIPESDVMYWQSEYRPNVPIESLLKK